MKEIKNWCVIISAVSILSGILLSLIPKSSLKTAFKSLVTVIMLYTAMLPFIQHRSIDFSFDDYISGNENLSEEYKNKSFVPAEKVAKQEIEKSINSSLKEENIQAGCEIECTVEADSFSVDKIILSGKLSDNEKKQAKRIIGQYMTEKTVLIFKGDEDELT